MKSLIKMLCVLAVLNAAVFAQEENAEKAALQEISAEELFNFATMGRPMTSNRFIRQAKEMSRYAASVDEKNISYEYMRAMKKETSTGVWFSASTLLAGIGCGLLLADESETTDMMIAGLSCEILGLTGVIISVSAMQKATLRKDMLIRKMSPVALKQVSVSGNGVSATWVFGKTKHFEADEIF